MQHRVEHAHAGAENRHQHNLLVNPLSHRLGDGRLDLDLLRLEILERLKGEKLGDFIHQFAEQFRRCGLVTHEGHAVIDERMVEDGGHEMPRFTESELRMNEMASFRWADLLN